VAWGGIAGRYFTALGIPDGPYTFSVSQNPVEGAPSGSQFAFIRPAVRTAEYEDVYRFYVGPKDEDELDRYDLATDNSFGYVELDLGSAVERRRLLGWLEDILRFGLEAFYRVIPNYGVAIIILTIVVKLLLFPLTKRSHESMAKMQEFQPKIQELREKYGNDQQKLNQEMTKLYQANGINPLGGCLPLVLQIPFFIAMFGLFNTSFDLRGATFIPGWITDLSAPESIWNFGGYQIPLLGWTDLRLLPILFVGTQILTTFFTQAPQTQGSGNQQALMMYGLPIIFFFVLYNMPSGLLVYWIMQNVLTAGQQYVMRRRRAAHH
jgi:YidC/Oxa1 family membrane protein insertase